MILSLFNLFLITVEISNLLLRITISIGQQFIKPFVPQKKKSVDGQIIVITGGGSGVGRAIALRFAKLNAIIVLWDNNKVFIQLFYPIFYSLLSMSRNQLRKLLNKSVKLVELLIRLLLMLAMKRKWN
jgi:hypothetical protein